MDKKVSVIIPTYNGEKYIEKTIESVLNQTHKNIELIIIDDNSKDSTVSIIEKIIKDKKNIVLIKNNPNLGLVKNINKGINLSTGDVVISLGHDDLLKENHIEKMLELFDEKTSFVYCNSELIDGEDKVFGVLLDETKNKINLENRKYKFSIGNGINSCGLLFDRKKALKVGGWEYFEEFPHYGEWYFWIKLLTVGEIKYNPIIKSQYRLHETNLTNTFTDTKAKINLKKYFLKSMSLAYKNFGNEFSCKEKIISKIYKIKVYLSLKKDQI